MPSKLHLRTELSGAVTTRPVPQGLYWYPSVRCLMAPSHERARMGCSLAMISGDDIKRTPTWAL